MDDYKVYALKASMDWFDIPAALKQGEGRFGWSYVDTADLHQLKERIERDGWESLSQEEKNCYQSFLLDIQADDYVVYINVPEWGQCTLGVCAPGWFGMLRSGSGWAHVRSALSSAWG